jgi:hypothetical protein
VPAGAELAGTELLGSVVGVAEADEPTAATSATPANAIIVLRQWRLM